MRIVVVDKGKQINQLKKSLQGKPTKDGIKFLDLSPNLHHAPCLNEDVSEDSGIDNALLLDLVLSCRRPAAGVKTKAMTRVVRSKEL